MRIMMALWLVFLAGVSLAGETVQVPVEKAASAGGEKDTLDLMSGYWRHHLTFSPARVDTNLLATNTGRIAARCKRKGIDMKRPFVGWPFYYEFVYAGHGESSPLTLLIRSAAPPPGWMKPGFNDSGWQRQRLPYTAGHPRPPCFSSEGQAVSHGVGLSCFRQQIMVDDPAKVRRLTLRIAYRGGVIVYVNGKEISRGHLPAGNVAPDVGGQSYPVHAYTIQSPIEGPAMEFWCSQDKRRVPNKFPTRPIPEFSRAWGLGDYRTGEIVKTKPPCPEMIRYHSWWNGGNFVITKPEWEQVMRVRNRVLGPVEVPAGILRKGVNVVAVEIHRSDLNPVIMDSSLGDSKWDSMGGYSWSHGCLLEMDAAVDPPGSVSLETRAAGLEVWTDDMHRRYISPEYGPSGDGLAPVRLVGARNGVYSGQVVLGTDKDITGVSASVSDLVGANGNRIPAAGIMVRYGKRIPLPQLGALSALRGFWDQESGQEPNVTLALQRLAGNRQILDKKANAKMASEVFLFDQLSVVPPGIPAGSCQPVWVTVAVPGNAVPGEYGGTLSLKAGAGEIRVPLRLWVMDWTVPEPKHFETVIALEQSPYGVARHYKVEPWSDRHFKLLTPSFKQLARVNNAYLVVPVLVGSEFGNGSDSPVIFEKKADGTYGCDLSRVEKYLDTAIQAGCMPRMVAFVVFHTGTKLRVRIRDASSGKTGYGDLPPLDSPELRKMLEPFVKGIQAVLKKRGLEKAGGWGYPWDELGDGFFSLAGVLAELAPDMGWARGCHAHRKGMKKLEKDPFTLIASIYDLGGAYRKDSKTRQYVVHSNEGWKNPVLRLVFPRVLSSAVTIYTDSVPFYYRIAPERAILAGARGIGRMGADYWAGIYTGGHVGATVTAVLGEGPEGAESTARFECLIEGVQETEARIFLERKLDGDWAATEPGRTAREILDQRIEETLIMPPGSASTRLGEYCGGWQERSWDLYAAAAMAAGGKAPAAEDKNRFFGSLPKGK